MSTVVITGASRGIGAALAVELARRGAGRLVLAGRDEAALAAVADEVAAVGPAAPVTVAADLSTVRAARAVGERLAAQGPWTGATLVHNAGLWPARRELTADGVERAFAVNVLAPLALQEPLLAAGAVARILTVGAGAMVKGRFDAARTPAGEDFSALRTYCTTKLCLAVAMRDVAAAHPHLDVAVVHPGVVRTGLGARGGPAGLALRLAKRRWEDPRVTARRLATILERRGRWAPPGDARWMVEDAEQEWPAAAEDPALRAGLAAVTGPLLAPAAV
jgi:NAD(P)-dependent dehydrogenase (short-subunit alcohol dehydrogenase family)